MRERLVWLLVLSLAAPMVAAAQEQKTVDPVVVTATKVATPSEQIGASISVVNGDDFQTYHYPTVDEALRNVPGVEIRRSGSYGKTSSITIRGANANQVQVLVRRGAGEEPDPGAGGSLRPLPGPDRADRDHPGCPVHALRRRRDRRRGQHHHAQGRRRALPGLPAAGGGQLRHPRHPGHRERGAGRS